MRGMTSNVWGMGYGVKGHRDVFVGMLLVLVTRMGALVRQLLLL